MLNHQTIEIIQSTIPLLEQHGREITDEFYKNLFINHPELKNIFNIANQGKGEQSRALSDAVVAYAKNIEQLEIILPVVQRIAHKHVSLGVEAKHYPVVGENLLAAIQQVLSLPDNHPALQAWAEAYGLLADVFIGVEKEIASTNSQQDGGWKGFKDFRIDQIVEETPLVKSFYLKPVNLEKTPNYQGGQYVGVKVHPNGAEYYEIRQYSLSSKEAFRISVKAENKGLVSNYLHHCKKDDVISLQAPTGVFTFAPTRKKTIFIAGGVGITPIMSMLQEAIKNGASKNDLLFIQCAKDPSHQIFKNELSALNTDNKYHHKLCYDNNDQGDHRGYLNQELIQAWLTQLNFDANDTQVYFCGPKPFMSALNTFFLNLNFSQNDIHYEIFGPTTAL